MVTRMYTPPCSVTLDLRAFERSCKVEDLWEVAMHEATAELLLQHQDDESMINDAMAEADVWDSFLTLYQALTPEAPEQDIVSLASRLKALIHSTLQIYLADDIKQRAEQIYAVLTGDCV